MEEFTIVDFKKKTRLIWFTFILPIFLLGFHLGVAVLATFFMTTDIPILFGVTFGLTMLVVAASIYINIKYKTYKK